MPETGRVNRTNVNTFTDGFGRWYAAVPGDLKDPRAAARRAIKRELEERGDIGPGFRLQIEEAPDHWLTTDRASRPVFREKENAR